MNRYALRKQPEKDFIQYPSVTQITGQIDKGEGLLQWAVNMAVDYIKETDDLGHALEINLRDQYFAIKEYVLNNARAAWKNKRDQTADIGTELHDIIEKYIKHSIKVKNALWLDNDQIRSHLKDRSPELIQMFMQFLLWTKKNVKRFIESEKPVCCTEKCYGGTADMIFQNFNNEIVLCDLKTKNALYGDDKFQVAAYKFARESMQGKYDVLFYGKKTTYEYKPIKIDRIAILKIARDYLDLEYKDYTKEYDFSIRSFLSLLSFFYMSKQRRLNNYRAKQRG